MKKSCKELKRLCRKSLNGNYGMLIAMSVLMSLIISLATKPFNNSISQYITKKLLEENPDILDNINPILQNSLGITGNQMLSSSLLSLIIGIAAIVVITLLATVLSAGMTNATLYVARGEKPTFSMLFREFAHRPDRYIVLALIELGVSLGFMAPGIVVEILSYTIVDDGMIRIILYMASIALFLAGSVFAIIFSFKFSLTVYYLLDNPYESVGECIKKSFKAMKGNCGRYFYIVLSFIPMTLLASLSFGIGNLFLSPYILTTTTWFYLDASGELNANEERDRRLFEEMGPTLE